MPITSTRVRFKDNEGKLHAVEVRRSTGRPVVSALHRALLTAGVVITSYHAQATSRGLNERLELASVDGQALSDVQSENVRNVVLPLAFDEE